MYNVYVKKQGSYNPDLAGEYSDLKDAVAFADKLKENDNSITYTIEETTGHFDSYGEPLTSIVKRG